MLPADAKRRHFVVVHQPDCYLAIVVLPYDIVAAVAVEITVALMCVRCRD